MSNTFLIAALNAKDYRLWFIIAVAAVAYLVVDKLLNTKHYIDTVQYKAARAGGVALEIGFKKFDELLFWCGAGNIKEVRKVLVDLWETYCQSDRGPIKLSRDVFMATWAKLRNDKEYGNECRQEVVHEALGLDINDRTDVTIAHASERLSKIGWAKLGKAADHMAAREWSDMTSQIKGLFDEVMEEDGEKKIAARVMKPTLDALWSDPKFRPAAEALVKEYAAKPSIVA